MAIEAFFVDKEFIFSLTGFPVSKGVCAASKKTPLALFKNHNLQAITEKGNLSVQKVKGRKEASLKSLSNSKPAVVKDTPSVCLLINKPNTCTHFRQMRLENALK